MENNNRKGDDMNRRNALKTMSLTALALAPVPILAKDKELPAGWMVEHSLSHWQGNTSKSFIGERNRSYEYGGKEMCAEEYAKTRIEEVRKVALRYGYKIVLLRYYPVYATDTVIDCM